MAALALALSVAVWGAVASVVGGRRKNLVLIESARTSAYSLLALALTAFVAMEVAILSDDFSLRYVAQNSSRVTPTFFKVLALWSADEGSLLLWNLVLAGYIASVAFRFRRRRPETLPWVMATMYGVAIFYLALVLGPTKPFATMSPVPSDGKGPLALLQNHPLMAAHPPLLYLGFIGFTVPFAFAIAALVSGRLTDEWIRTTRRWTLAAWTFLTLGLLLGGLWSYGVLGWGGYWAWDPVENTALLPWLTATAFLHSVMAEERRGILKVWNLALIIGTFALTIFGTLLTRGSILYSVHAFSESVVGYLYLGFLVLVLLGGFGLIAARSKLLAAETAFDTPLSREAAFLGNNLMLIVMTFTVLLGTIYPLIAEATTGRQISVGAPYFNRTTLPVVLLLLMIMAAGPILPWRAGSKAQLTRRLRIPAWIGALTIVALAAAGMRSVAPLMAFGLSAFVLSATVAELARGVRTFRRSFGGGIVAATLHAGSRNRRFYGGLVAHVGLVLVAIAITASSSFDRRAEMTLGLGERFRFLQYEVRLERVRDVTEPHRSAVVADLTLWEQGRRIGMLSPRMNFYPGNSDPIGTPSIRTGTPANGFRDLYLSVRSFTEDRRSAAFRIQMNPGTTWLWIGGAVMALGGLLAAWPHSRPKSYAQPASESVAEKVGVGP